MCTLINNDSKKQINPERDMLNCFCSEGCLPPSWKADAGYSVSIPEEKASEGVYKDLRPISLTPVLCKIAEKFVIDGYVGPAMLNPRHTCVNQHGSFVDQTDTLGSTVRVVLLDYRKTFDVIYYSCFKKGCQSQALILEPKGTLGIVIMSDNAPAKFVTVWPWHYDEPALYIMQSQC